MALKRLSKVARYLLSPSIQCSKCTQSYGHVLNYTTAPQTAPTTPSAAAASGYYAAQVHGDGLVRIDKIVKPLSAGDNDLIVRVDSAGLNNADLMMISGKHHLKPDIPYVPGFELAGEVLAVGHDVRTIKVGDRVCALKKTGMGAFAQMCLVNAHDAHPIPHNVDYETAAAMPVAYGTALHTLRDVLRVHEWKKEKPTILIVTSQGGTGMACVDLAQNVYKCKVIVATDSNAKSDVARQMGGYIAGATQCTCAGVLATVEYTDEKMPKLVHKLSSATGGGVDMCIDTVGGHWFDLAMKCLRPGGHLATVAFSSQTVPTISLDTLIRNRITVSGMPRSVIAPHFRAGVWFGGRCSDKATGAEFLSDTIETLIQWRDDSYCQPKADVVYTLAKLDEAISVCQSKPPLGKVIITCRDDPALGAKTS